MTILQRETETSAIPDFNFLALSDRQRTLFGSVEGNPTTAHLTTPDEESSITFTPRHGQPVEGTRPAVDHAHATNVVWPRSGYQIAVDTNLYREMFLCNVLCRPTNPFFDLFNIRRDAVSETISAWQSQAEDEGTRYSVAREVFLNLFKRYASGSCKAIFDKLESFSRLLPGWDGYRARPPEKVAIRSAKMFLSQLNDSDRAPDRVKPSVIGGIGITFRANQRKCYVEFYNNGTVYVLFSDGQSEPETCQVRPTAQDYKLLIKAIQDYLNADNP